MIVHGPFEEAPAVGAYTHRADHISTQKTQAMLGSGGPQPHLTDYCSTHQFTANVPFGLQDFALTGLRSRPGRFCRSAGRGRRNAQLVSSARR